MQIKRLDSNFLNYLFIYSLVEKSPITDQSYYILEILFPVAKVTLSRNYKKKKNSDVSLTVIVYNGWDESFEEFDRCRKKCTVLRTSFIHVLSNESEQSELVAKQFREKSGEGRKDLERVIEIISRETFYLQKNPHSDN